MVTKETTLETISSDGRTIQKFILTETKSVAAVMDPANPIKVAKGKKLLFMTSNQIPGSSAPLPAVVGYAFNTQGHAIEERDFESAYRRGADVKSRRSCCSGGSCEVALENEAQKHCDCRLILL